MTATDELRRLLDERGIEWWEEYGFTYWKNRFGYSCNCATGHESGMVSVLFDAKPEQAVEATLGRGECRLKRANWDDGTCTWGCICSACDAHLEHETGIGYSFCPHCGAKVVRA